MAFNMDILSDIGGDRADHSELEHVLLSYFHQSSQPTNDTVLYGEHGQPALVLRSAADGRIISLTPGPTFRETDREELRRIVSEQLLSDGGIKIGRVAMFAGVPTIGHFRFRDDFQILPVPPEAPRPEFAVGDHPFILEVAYPSSADHDVNALRFNKRKHQTELLCSVLLSPSPHAQSNNATFHWVYEPIVDGKLVSTYRQGGYAWAGASFQGEVFSSTDGLPALPESDSQTYYSQHGVAVGDTLGIPTTFVQSLELVNALHPSEREKFIRACYWYKQSLLAWGGSRSLAFSALVSAIEAIMPEPEVGNMCPTCNRSKGAGPTKNFAEFVDRYVPEIPLRDRKRFYSLRSAISHGGKLLRSDEGSWGIGIEQANQDQDTRTLSRIVRAALINWLHTHQGT